MQYKIFEGRKCIILSDSTIWNWVQVHGYRYLDSLMIYMAGIFQADVMCKAEAELRGII